MKLFLFAMLRCYHLIFKTLISSLNTGLFTDGTNFHQHIADFYLMNTFKNSAHFRLFAISSFLETAVDHHVDC